jgi:hypothetical protein
MKTWLVKTYGSRASVETNLINAGRYSYILDSGKGGRQLGPEHAFTNHQNEGSFKREINKIRPTWGIKLLQFSKIKKGDRLIMLSGSLVMAIGTAKTDSRFVKTKELSKARKLPLWGHELDVNWKEHNGSDGLGRELRFKGTRRKFIHGVIYDVTEEGQLLKFIGAKGKNVGREHGKQEAQDIHPEDPVYVREGELQTHDRVERNRDPKITKDAKWLARKLGGGVIQCEGCDIKIKKAYDYEVIDAHHIVPLASASKEGQETYLGDLAMLCPTCHRLTHRILAAGLADEMDAINHVRAKHKLSAKSKNTLHQYKRKTRL